MPRKIEKLITEAAQSGITLSRIAALIGISANNFRKNNSYMGAYMEGVDFVRQKTAKKVLDAIDQGDEKVIIALMKRFGLFAAPVRITKLTSVASAKKQMSEVSQLLADGIITPERAQPLLATAQRYVDFAGVKELMDRVEKIEEQLQEKGH